MIKFKTHNNIDIDIDIDINGTSYVGEIDVSYKELKETFGFPTDADGHKVDAQWSIEIEEIGKNCNSRKAIATIYNYKNGVNYNGRKEGIPKTKIRDWHIGGTEKRVVQLIKTIIKEKKKDKIRKTLSRLPEK